jgi:peptidylamidoglycolate lyase
MKQTLLIIALVFAGALSAYWRGPESPDQRSFQVVHGWPTLPDGFALGQVPGVAVDSHDHVFVFHRGDRPIVCFDSESGEIVASWGDGLFETAHGLAVDSEDNVWVTDQSIHQVFKFSHQGELLMTLGERGVGAWDERHFNEPTDVAVTPTGTVYVADGHKNQRVVKFSKDGKFLLEWGGKGEAPGEFAEPHGLAIDSEGRVYVADRANSRIQVFDGNGEFLQLWKSEELGRPWGLEVGPDGFLYVADGGDLKEKPPDRNRALKLDLEGNILEEWGSFGSYDGQFYWAHDVAVSKTGAVYVVDVHLGMRVQKFVPR